MTAMSPDEMEEIRQAARERNRADVEAGRIPRHIEDPTVLLLVAGWIEDALAERERAS